MYTNLFSKPLANLGAAMNCMGLGPNKPGYVGYNSLYGYGNYTKYTMMEPTQQLDYMISNAMGRKESRYEN